MRKFIGMSFFDMGRGERSVVKEKFIPVREGIAVLLNIALICHLLDLPRGLASSFIGICFILSVGLFIFDWRSGARPLAFYEKCFLGLFLWITSSLLWSENFLLSARDGYHHSGISLWSSSLIFPALVFIPRALAPIFGKEWIRKEILFLLGLGVVILSLNFAVAFDLITLPRWRWPNGIHIHMAQSIFALCFASLAMAFLTSQRNILSALVLVLFIAFSLYYVLLVSASRAGYLGAVIFLLSVIGYLVFRLDLTLRINWAVAALILIVISIGWSAVSDSDRFGRRVVAAEKELLKYTSTPEYKRRGSVSVRLNAWKFVIENSLIEPFGVGVGDSMQVIQQHQKSQRIPMPNSLYVHSEYAHQLLIGGFPGLLMLVAGCVGLLITIVGCHVDKTKRWFFITGLLVFYSTNLSVSYFTEIISQLFIVPMIALFIAMTVARGASYEKDSVNSEKELSRSWA